MMTPLQVSAPSRNLLPSKVLISRSILSAEPFWAFHAILFTVYQNLGKKNKEIIMGLFSVQFSLNRLCSKWAKLTSLKSVVFETNFQWNHWGSSQIYPTVHVHLKTNKVDLEKKPPWKKNNFAFFFQWVEILMITLVSSPKNPSYTIIYAIESVQDFLIKLDMKPGMYVVEISIFSLNHVIVRLTKIMKNQLEHLKICTFEAIFLC